jgi:hypothetical protein
MPTSVMPSSRWAVVFFFLYLAVQIALPVYRLFQPRPTRFGWQMFSASSVPSRVWLVSSDSVREISPAAYIGNFRSDLEYERYALPFLCRARPEATAIRYVMPIDNLVREYRC